MEINEAISEVKYELQKATAAFPPFHSPHEGLAIIMEEFEELKEEAFRQHHLRTIDTMRKEAKQVAAMAIRFMVDLT